MPDCFLRCRDEARVCRDQRQTRLLGQHQVHAVGDRVVQAASHPEGPGRQRGGPAPAGLTR